MLNNIVEIKDNAKHIFLHKEAGELAERMEEANNNDQTLAEVLKPD